LFSATDKAFGAKGPIALWTNADSITRFDRIEIRRAARMRVAVRSAIALAVLSRATGHAAETMRPVKGREITKKFTGMEFRDDVHWAYISKTRLAEQRRRRELAGAEGRAVPDARNGRSAVLRRVIRVPLPGDTLDDVDWSLD
jgi:hypothetical protein